MDLPTLLVQILDELGRTLTTTSPAGGEKLATAILAAERVFLAGAGRSGLAMRAFAMRLTHMGLTVHVVGDVTTPSIGEGDLLLIGSGSGSTATLLIFANKAIAAGARLALITGYADSPIGQIADMVHALPTSTPKRPQETGFQSIQPMGTHFEQSLSLTLDALVLILMSKQHLDSATMFARHANLE